MMEFTKELIDKAKACQTAEELLTLAKENEIEMTKEDAEALLGEFREGELADEELDNVAGGVEGCKPANTYEMVYWPTPEEVQFIFKEGDIVQALNSFCNHHTATCKVVSIKVQEYAYQKYADLYWLEKEPGGRTPFIKTWTERRRIEK